VAAVSADFNALTSPPWLDRDVRSTLRMMAGRTSEPNPAPKRTTPITSDPTAVDASAELVGKARSGDRTAFRQLFERHRADVARLVYRMVGPRADLEDLVQEVFVQVHRSLRDFRGESRFSTWLHRVTVNVVLMQRRAERSRPALTDELPITLEDASSVHPDDEAERRARIAAFFELLAKITEKKRVVFVLHDLEGKSPAEIADIVGAPVLTVRTRLFYARRELETMMRAHPMLAGVVELHGGFAGETEGGSQVRQRSSTTTGRESNGGAP
jgi:RNA polymerase sigma-70 factor (ECF subfamily)